MGNFKDTVTDAPPEIFAQDHHESHEEELLEEVEVLELQRSCVKTELDALLTELLHLKDRVKYYDEPLTLEQLEHVIKQTQTARKVAE